MTNLYRKKPVVIKAVQYDGTNQAALAEFTNNQVDMDTETETISVWDKLHYTWVKFYKDDWIIKGIRNEFYPCNGQVFLETYEKVED
jgi:hypothetical protein